LYLFVAYSINKFKSKYFIKCCREEFFNMEEKKFMEKRKNFLKEASVLLIAAILVLASIVVLIPITEVVKAAPPPNEDFLGGIPPLGWTDEHKAYSSYYGWSISYSTQSGGTSPEAMLPYYYALADYKFYSDVFSTPPSTVCSLNFKYYINHYEGTSDYSLHAGYCLSDPSIPGAIWLSPWIVFPSSSGQYTVSVNIPSNQPIVYIGFWIEGNPWNFNYWYIDDVKVTCGPTTNIPPVAVPESYCVCYNSQTVFNVLANDYDPDGTIVLTTINIVTPPLLGVATADLTTGLVTYTHNPLSGYGSDSFTYTVNDNNGATSNLATVTVTICCLEIVSLVRHPTQEDKLQVTIQNHCGTHFNGVNQVPLKWEFTIDPTNAPCSCCGDSPYLTNPSGVSPVYIENNHLDNLPASGMATGTCKVTGNAFFILKLTITVPSTGCECEIIKTGCVGDLHIC
jgi:hypothetical protein